MNDITVHPRTSHKPSTHPWQLHLLYLPYLNHLQVLLLLSAKYLCNWFPFFCPHHDYLTKSFVHSLTGSWLWPGTILGTGDMGTNETDNPAWGNLQSREELIINMYYFAVIGTLRENEAWWGDKECGGKRTRVLWRTKDKGWAVSNWQSAIWAETCIVWGSESSGLQAVRKKNGPGEEKVSAEALRWEPAWPSWWTTRRPGWLEFSYEGQRGRRWRRRGSWGQTTKASEGHAGGFGLCSMW